MQLNNTTDLLQSKGIKTKKVTQTDEYVLIEAETEKIKKCPYCHSKKIWIHDNRHRTIKDTPIYGKKAIIHLKTTRYDCRHCGKRFTKETDLVPKKHTISKRLTLTIINELKESLSMSAISRNLNISINTVQRLVTFLKHPRNKLPKILCIDEFKGDVRTGKYQCSLLNGETHSITDIIKSRNSKDLTEYFGGIDKTEKENVEYFISDMWEPYRSVKNTYFKNSTHIIDKYHFIRQVLWALEDVRKRVQKNLEKKLRIYYKRSKSLLTKPRSKLKNDEIPKVTIMLENNKDLQLAYQLKELFYENVLKQPTKERAEKALKEWLRRAEKSGLKEFKRCMTSFKNWFDEITNSFDYPYTNGPLEGTHTKIKTLKRISYGFRNFDSFRNRIFLMCK